MSVRPTSFMVRRGVDRDGRDAREEALRFEALPVREQVLDRLADLMLDADDILGTDAAGELRTITPEIEDVFDRVNRLMVRLSD